MSLTQDSDKHQELKKLIEKVQAEYNTAIQSKSFDEAKPIYIKLQDLKRDLEELLSGR